MKKTLFLLLALIPLLGSCLTYSRNKRPEGLELPAVSDGETIITYSGYSDILYAGSAKALSDPSKVAYTVSFDRVRRLPKWVAYDLSSDELGGGARRNGKSFRPDDKARVPQADNSDYKGSGWTRGHLAPAGDFTWSDQAMDDTFYFTNCCPQTQYLNGTAWNNLEERVRSWAKKFGVVYIVSGPIFGNHESCFLNGGKIPVPDAFFKAVLAPDGDSFQAVAFVMENSSEPQPYPSCALSVNALEDIIGLNLFPALDDRIEESVEAGFSRRFWGM